MARDGLTFRIDKNDTRLLALKMKKLEADVRGKIGKAATREGAKVIRAGVELEAPMPATAPVHIKDSVRHRYNGRESTPWSFVYEIFILKAAFYWRFVEYGSIHNPSPDPFFRRGFEKSKHGALFALTRKLRDRLKKV